MATHTFVPHPIFEALLKASRELGGVQWNSISEIQKYFLSELYNPHSVEVGKFSSEELRSWASEVADELNKILSDEGFDIRLDELQENEIGVVAILDILLDWLKEGIKLKLYSDDIAYPGVRINSSMVEGYSTFLSGVNCKNYDQRIAMLRTQKNDVVYMAIADKELGDFKLFKHIMNIRQNIAPDVRPVFVHFPMIDLDHQPDVNWLVGMPHTGGGQITQAMQQTKFKMNEKGAHLKSAVAIVAKRGMSPAEHGIVIDKPFYLWIERPGIELPIMCAYMDRDVWSDPGNLDM